MKKELPKWLAGRIEPEDRSRLFGSHNAFRWSNIWNYAFDGDYDYIEKSLETIKKGSVYEKDGKIMAYHQCLLTYKKSDGTVVGWRAIGRYKEI